MQDEKPDTTVLDDNNLVIVTTPEYVKDSIKEAIEEHATSRNHPYATQAEPGFVTLSNETDSDSEITVATSKAVKKTYDLANIANQNANNVNKNANNANDNANTRLAKDQNGADIPNKEEFVKNLGLDSRIEELSLPVGVPVPWPTEIPPEGWLVCNGDSFDKVRYPKLAIAYPSGKLPDLRGEFIRGWDHGRGIDPKRTLLSEQNATMMPLVYTYAESRTEGVLVTPPMSAYGSKLGGLMPGDYEDSTRTSADSYLTTRLTQGGRSALVTFRVRPRNIAFNYIVRAA
ncbi:phage tail protein [Xenorhabdus bovienii]|uniref:Putative E14 prophage tail fiber protein (Modular protein) n=1 Tax=Xenorhabdus bovienii str. kraussei Becker Underwood TaxID=1398204 RepID=A0A077PLF2_XENBV|nr:phage tail protein [Xenorhabdus bovienii]CDH25175.1 putative E14 prophage; tail fiber protein (Modular protein) [Xenorhabdus bovienii str. kraussei Becker Underwood]